jgi:replicative DNA helicase
MHEKNKYRGFFLKKRPEYLSPWIHLDSKNGQEVELKIGKNRNGPVGKQGDGSVASV